MNDHDQHHPDPHATNQPQQHNAPVRRLHLRLTNDLPDLDRQDAREIVTEIMEQYETLASIPTDLLPPDHLARLALRWLILSGWNAYAYQSGGTTGTWVCWLQPLADHRPDRNGRVTIQDWRDHWPAILLEARIFQYADDDDKRGSNSDAGSESAGEDNDERHSNEGTARP
jgi:hypothetical protein